MFTITDRALQKFAEGSKKFPHPQDVMLRIAFAGHG
jgi:hypothetical protein